MSALFPEHPEEISAGGEWSNSEVEAASVPMRECWRCGKLSREQSSSCRFCRAKFKTLELRYNAESESKSFHLSIRPLKVLIVFFCLLLATTIFQAWHIHFGDGLPAGPKREQELALLHEMLVVEAIDTLLVLLAMFQAVRLRQSCKRRGCARRHG